MWVRVPPPVPFYIMNITINGKPCDWAHARDILTAVITAFLTGLIEVGFVYACWNLFICKQFSLPEATFLQTIAFVLGRNIFFLPVVRELQHGRNTEE